MTHILGIGNALVDSLVQVNNDLILKELSLPKGSMQLIDTERYLELQNRMEAYAPKRTTGGSACNTILAIAHMGGQPGLIGKIGHDEPGRFFAKAFREQGVKTQMLYDKELPTGVASTFITPRWPTHLRHLPRCCRQYAAPRLPAALPTWLRLPIYRRLPRPEPRPHTACCPLGSSLRHEGMCRHGELQYRTRRP